MNSFVAANASLLATVSLFSAALHATPTVSGNVISLPDDGWYQVQSKEDYTSFCQGIQKCEVVDGDYIVINHSTGERFDVSVAGAVTVTELTVVGNTISWPDDGWYQVQHATNYSSVCQGGRSCEVAPGVYTVINHTTGERFKNVLVNEDNGGNQSTDGILGFGDHLYLENGNSEQKIDRITREDEPFLLSVFQDKSLISAYFSESLTSHIERVVEQASNVQQSQKVVANNEVFFPETKTTTNSVFDCDAGGTMTYTGVAVLAYGPDNTPFEGSIRESHILQGFEFTNCHSVYSQTSSAEISFPAKIHPYGEYALNGLFIVEIDRNSAPSKNYHFFVDHSWNNFSIVAEAPSQWSITADGESSNHRYATTASGLHKDISSNYRYVFTGGSGDIQEQVTASIP